VQDRTTKKQQLLLIQITARLLGKNADKNVVSVSNNIPPRVRVGCAAQSKQKRKAASQKDKHRIGNTLTITHQLS
jgi:hypothetical protein